MYFKALTVYRLDRKWLDSLPSQLAGVISEHPLREIAPSALECHGWDPAVVESAGAEQIVLLRDYRALPAAAVRLAADRRIAEIEARQGFRLSRKARRQIAEDETARMTPRIPVQRAELQAVLDRGDGWLLVNTSSRARAADLTIALRSMLGSLPAAPITSPRGASALMTLWMAAGAPPAPFAFDDECQLVGRDERKASVRYQRHELGGSDVVGHLRSGKLVTRLAMTWRGRIAFVMDEQLVLHRVRFLEDELIAHHQQEFEADQLARADLTLMVGMMRDMLADLVAATEPAQP